MSDPNTPSPPLAVPPRSRERGREVQPEHPPGLPVQPPTTNPPYDAPPYFSNHNPFANNAYQPPQPSIEVPVDPFNRRDSDMTATNITDEDSGMTWASHRHPADIPPPPIAFSGSQAPGPPPSPPDSSPWLRKSSMMKSSRGRRPSVHFNEDEKGSIDDRREADAPRRVELPYPDDANERPLKRHPRSKGRKKPKKGLTSLLIDLALLRKRRDDESYSEDEDDPSKERLLDDRDVQTVDEQGQPIDEFDPRREGKRSKHHFKKTSSAQITTLEEFEKFQKMSDKEKAKFLKQKRIVHNVCDAKENRKFLVKLASALMTFGAPSHRIESQLVAASKCLREDSAEFIHLPGIIICSFGDQAAGASQTFFVKAITRLSLGALHKVHDIYKNVTHDTISATTASEMMDAMMDEPPLYNATTRCILAFFLSALICPLAFGGSFLDMWIAGAGAAFLQFLQLKVVSKNALYANVFEITTAMLISFMARGLSSIRSGIFCYTAISSAGIVGILPGYLILSSSLELASKNIVCGSVKMVYSLIYTLFLGFGLQIGSDFYLLFDKVARSKLTQLAMTMNPKTQLAGSWIADNGTRNNSVPTEGTWTFTHKISAEDLDIVAGCHRPKEFPWYLQAFPLWTSFIIVPTFSILSSLSHLQPWRSREICVMVIISCASYAANKVANHYIFNRSDIVSAIGAFTVGLLGNAYSRRFGGTAFTSMVVGVLFLVPSGLSSAGGLTANGNGIDIGGAMIAVTIGITVGLFMSQAFVYMFGSRKNSALFSF